MRISLSVFLLSFGLLSYGEESLPKITPEFVSDMQRLAITLRLAEFPLTQKEYREYLALPPFSGGFGVGGKEIRSHDICDLSDPHDPLGYYGINIYWGKRQPEPPFDPLVEEIELFFQPGNMGEYPPTSEFVLRLDIPGEIAQKALLNLRAKMHEAHMTPGQFVKEWYKKHQRAQNAKQDAINTPNRVAGSD